MHNAPLYMQKAPVGVVIAV